ncbi:putative PEP-binding protein [Methylobacterium oryzae CBMB20]
MVATVDEFVRARGIVERGEGVPEARTATGSRPIAASARMIEVPSLLFQIDEIAREADFLSGGLERPDAVPVRGGSRRTGGSPTGSIR